MPELPEVEVTRQGLLLHLPDRVVLDIFWSGCQLRSDVPHQLLLDHICGKQISTIDRRAKYLLVRMTDGAVLLLHLGMTGKISILPTETAKHKHDHIMLRLDDGKTMRFNDSRRFGQIAVWPAALAKGLERDFSERQGVEPLGESFNQAFLVDLARKYTAPVKAILMNSRRIAGIGNIYANEILFAARVSPMMTANKVSAEEWQSIVEATGVILRKAIAAGGSTIADFLGTGGHPGYFQLHFQVYSRKNLPCFRCGQAIIKTMVGGRATFFCATCQPQR